MLSDTHTCQSSCAMVNSMLSDTHTCQSSCAMVNAMLSDTHTCPSSCAMVNAALRPLSSLIEQLRCMSHIVPNSAKPEESNNNTNMKVTMVTVQWEKDYQIPKHSQCYF